MLISEISIRGLRSFGNSPQVITLSKDHGDLCLLVGRNGAGKSTFLDSFDFSLFGKVRGKKKKWATLATLPNRINRELETIIKFESDGIDAVVRRGISPNVLELTENNVVIDRAGKANIDERIEKYVGMDLTTFKSFISMSINDFKDFMSLSSEEKKILTDKLFNLEVISTLNTILKELAKDNLAKMRQLDTSISSYQTSIASFRSSIARANEKAKENLDEELTNLNESMNSRKEEYQTLTDKMKLIQEKEQSLSSDIQKERDELSKLRNEITNVDREIALYDKGKCPTCSNDFMTEHYASLRSVLEEKRAKIQEVAQGITARMQEFQEKGTKLQSIKVDTKNAFDELSYFLRNTKSKIDTINQKINNKSEYIDIDEFEKGISELEYKIQESIAQVEVSKEKEMCFKTLAKVFGEDGAKKALISAIVSPINAFIQENIQAMGLPFEIVLDEFFDTTIYSFGQEVEQDSLSTGEAKLINISILIAYLKLIRTKKHINILFLDEVFASVDLENIECILILLKSFAQQYNINIFVVHHALLREELFDRIFIIEKEIFTKITEVKNGTTQTLS